MRTYNPHIKSLTTVASEDKLIRRIVRALPSQLGASHGDIRLGIGDDAAILKSSNGFEWVVSCDNFIEGVHFLKAMHPPDSVGYKSLVRATSDLVAMGAKPHGFIMALAWPADQTSNWLDEFLRGMARAARLLDMVLIGGDTTVSKIVTVILTVFGKAKEGVAVKRSGARPEDRIYVSGRLGGAQLGLELLRDLAASGGRSSKSTEQRVLRPLLAPHLYPQIRVELGLRLARNRIPSAMMDLSDGLSTDLTRLCEASGVGAKLWAEKVPKVRIPAGVSGWVLGLDPAPQSSARQNPSTAANRRTELDPLQMALHGGDDYQLLFTVPPWNEWKLRKLLTSARRARFCDLTCIGEITRLTSELRHAASRILLVGAGGHSEPLKPGGWDPFEK